MAQHEDRPADDARPGSEVSGRALRVVVDGAAQCSAVTVETVRRTLGEHDLPETPDADDWYDQGPYLAAVDELVDRLGDSAVRAVGEQFPTVVQWDAEPETVAEAMLALAQWYRRAHRGERTGCLLFERTDETAGRLTAETPYPCAFELGTATGLARHVADDLVTLTEAGHCRTDGADACHYDLSW